MTHRRPLRPKSARRAAMPEPYTIAAERLNALCQKGDLYQLNKAMQDMGFTESIPELDIFRELSSSVERAIDSDNVSNLLNALDSVSRQAFKIIGIDQDPRERYKIITDEQIRSPLMTSELIRQQVIRYMTCIKNEFPDIPKAIHVQLAKARREGRINLFAAYVTPDSTPPFMVLDVFYDGPMQDFRVLESCKIAREHALEQDHDVLDLARHLSLYYGPDATEKMAKISAYGAQSAIESKAMYDKFIDRSIIQDAPKTVIDALKMERNFLYGTD